MGSKVNLPPSPASKDAFGFQFWLFWILGFAGSFLGTAAFWTLVIAKCFGTLEQPEFLITWTVAVFGCWFLILTPFMRKKERIWKRLNNDQEKATNAWLAAMGIFIAALILTCLFWDWRLKDRVFASPGFDRTWAKYVFTSWLIFTLPLLVFLYKKADQIYKAAAVRQTQWGPKFQTAYLEKSKRTLPESVAARIKSLPETMDEGHVLHLILKDGRKIPHVFVFRGAEVLGVYDVSSVDFEIDQVMDAEPVLEMPVYEESKWLRLDGRA